jgi:plasmid maintenance system antidote protein VapI
MTLLFRPIGNGLGIPMLVEKATIIDFSDLSQYDMAGDVLKNYFEDKTKITNSELAKIAQIHMNVKTTGNTGRAALVYMLMQHFDKVGDSTPVQEQTHAAASVSVTVGMTLFFRLAANGRCIPMLIEKGMILDLSDLSQYDMGGDVLKQYFEDKAKITNSELARIAQIHMNVKTTGNSGRSALVYMLMQHFEKVVDFTPASVTSVPTASSELPTASVPAASSEVPTAPASPASSEGAASVALLEGMTDERKEIELDARVAGAKIGIVGSLVPALVTETKTRKPKKPKNPVPEDDDEKNA